MPEIHRCVLRGATTTSWAKSRGWMNVDEIRDRRKQKPGPEKATRDRHSAAGESQGMAGLKQNRLNLTHKRNAIELDDVEQQIRSFFR